MEALLDPLHPVVAVIALDSTASGLAVAYDPSLQEHFPIVVIFIPKEFENPTYAATCFQYAQVGRR